MTHRRARAGSANGTPSLRTETNARVKRMARGTVEVTMKALYGDQPRPTNHGSTFPVYEDGGA
jgi:hypothetical protein